MLSFLFLTLSFLVNVQSQKAPEIAFGTVVLYHPSDVLVRRVPNVKEVAGFIEAISDSIKVRAIELSDAKKQEGAIIIAVKPDGQKSVWFSFPQELDAKTIELIRDIVNKQKPPKVQEGVFVYAQWIGLNGAAATGNSIPAPKEWLAAAKKSNRPLNTDEVIELSWQK